MLLETYKADGLMWLTNVNGTIGDDKEAFRGDLVLEFGDMHESSQTRNPPKKVVEQAVVYAKGGKIAFFVGYLGDIQALSDLHDRFKSDMADGVEPIVFVFNIDKPVQVAADGVTYACVPLTEGMVWNELMDLLYIEKSDLKGQSAEQKVETVAGARGEYASKGDVVDLNAVMALANGAVRQYAGAI